MDNTIRIKHRSIILLLLSTTTTPLLLHSAIHMPTDITVLPLYTVVLCSRIRIVPMIDTTTTISTITTTTTTITIILLLSRGRTYDLEGGDVRAAEVNGRRNLLFRA